MRRSCIALVLVLACTRDEVRSPAAATSTATPDGEAQPAGARPKPAETSVPDGVEPVPSDPVAKQLPPARVVTLVPGGGELSEQLATAASRAKADGLVPVVEMWAGWCPPCKKLDRLLDDPAFADSLGGLALVRLDTDAWGEALDAAGFDAPSIPTFYALDAMGRPRGKPLSGAKWGKLDADAIAAKLRELGER